MIQHQNFILASNSADPKKLQSRNLWTGLFGQQSTNSESNSHLKHGVDQVRAELPPGADGDGPRELVLRDGLVGQRVHAHGDLRSGIQSL